MNVNQLIVQLQTLQYEGRGGMKVFYRHGASGDCGPVGSPHVTDEVDDQCGPFDLEPGEKYVSLYIGN